MTHFRLLLAAILVSNSAQAAVRTATWDEQTADAAGKVTSVSVTGEIWTETFQEDLEQGRANDYSVGIGTLKNIVFENLTFNRPGSIQVHADTDGLTVRGAKLRFAPTVDHRLIELGPKSMTYKGAPGTDPAKWTEIFSPDLDCTVRNLAISGVRTRDAQTDLPIGQVVKVIELKPNPDYPKTTPKSGSGKGIWIR